MISIWEKQSFLQADVVVLGAGITGLSTAASLKEADPSLHVIVLEKGVLPSGASTKNAGFACFGSASELLSDLEKLGQKGMLSLVEKRWIGLNKTIDRLGAESIDLQNKSGYELIFRNDDTPEKIDYLNTLLHSIFREEVFRPVTQKIGVFGFDGVKHLIENRLEGQLDTGKLIQSLWKYCTQLGVGVHTGFDALHISEEGNGVSVSSKKLKFRAKKIAVCTNAFTKKIIPEIADLNPGRGIVLLISPQDPLQFQGTFHYDEGFYYFRDYRDQLIFGGGRNLDLYGEETLEFGVNEQIKTKLLQDLKKTIIPNQRFKIEMEWSGIMAFGTTKEPIIKQVSDNIVAGIRLGGMGVAIGSLVGEEVSKLLLKID